MMTSEKYKELVITSLLLDLILYPICVYFVICMKPQLETYFFIIVASGLLILASIITTCEFMVLATNGSLDSFLYYSTNRDYVEGEFSAIIFLRILAWFFLIFVGLQSCFVYIDFTPRL